MYMISVYYHKYFSVINSFWESNFVKPRIRLDDDCYLLKDSPVFIIVVRAFPGENVSEVYLYHLSVACFVKTPVDTVKNLSVLNSQIFKELVNTN